MQQPAQFRYTLRPSVPDLRDHVLTVPRNYAEPLKAGLGITVPFRNQSNEGACGGFASTSAASAALVALGKGYTAFAPAASYWWARSLIGMTNEDSGTTIQDEMKAAVKFGFAPESLMPYRAGDFRTAPSAEAAQAATAHAALEYWRIPARARAVKYALDHKKAGVVIGIAVYDSFEAAFSQGPIPMPDPARERMLGGHALFVHDMVDDASLPGGGKAVGDGSWGNTEPFELPYAYLFNSRLCFEIRCFALKA